MSKLVYKTERNGRDIFVHVWICVINVLTNTNQTFKLHKVVTITYNWQVYV